MGCIVRFSVYTHRNELGGNLWNPAIRWSSKYAVFVLLEDDGGFSGLGECWCFDTEPDALVAYLRTEIAPHIIGLNIEQYEKCLSDLARGTTLTARHGMFSSAIAGVDIAIWDMRAIRAACPLWYLLNPNGDGCVSLYGSGGLYGAGKDIATLAGEMLAMSEDGFSTVKMKVGGAAISEDRDRVNTVVGALPDSVNLIIDGVYSYQPDQALSLYRSLPTARIEAFQAPLMAKDIDGMAWLLSQGVPVMASEAEYREEIHDQLVARHAVRYLQSAPISCGGLSGMQKLSDRVGNTAIQLSLEVSSTAVATMAACQYAAADAQVVHVEYHYVHQVFFELLRLEPVAGCRGQFRLPEIPGLGIRLPEDSVSRQFALEHSSV